jgi:CrcB protein
VTPGVALLVALGAALGASVRFAVERRLVASYPWGTWLVNVAGSAVLGALAAVVASGDAGPSPASVVALVGTGFCGSLTTFGGFAAQVLDLAVGPVDALRSSRAWRALGYGSVSVVACVAVAAAAYGVATAMSSR